MGTEEYQPIQKNCSAHNVAFERIKNKTDEALDTIKPQEVYYNETEILKGEIRDYADKLSQYKQGYTNATKERVAFSLDHENKTLECLTHMDLHKRMVKML